MSSCGNNAVGSATESLFSPRLFRPGAVILLISILRVCPRYISQGGTWAHVHTEKEKKEKREAMGGGQGGGQALNKQINTAARGGRTGPRVLLNLPSAWRVSGKSW